MSTRAVSTDAAREVLLVPSPPSSDDFRKRALVCLSCMMLLIMWRVVVGVFSLSIDPTTMKMTQSFMNTDAHALDGVGEGRRG